MGNLLGRLLGRRQSPALPTHLSEQEALAIALAAAVDEPLGDLLAGATVHRDSGRAIWLVTSATIGSVLQVSVDDETGRVLDVRTLGLR